MAEKTRQSRVDATQVFRQFAWNLAGTLAKSKPAKAAARRPSVRRTSTKRVASK